MSYYEPETDSDSTYDSDGHYLKMLSLFHYVLGGIQVFFSLFPVFHLVMGIAMLSSGMGSGKNAPPQVVAVLFTIIPAAMIFFGLAYAAALLYAGRCLAKTRGYTFCFAVAVISLLSMPFGTVLGIFTLVALFREGVKERFARTD
jgi:uncharacterized membrane protein